jgi:hypothetical protein
MYNSKDWAKVTLRLGWPENQMPKAKKISTKQFAREFANVAEQALGKLPADDQEKRIVAFERAVSKISRDGNSKASRTHQTPSISLHTRARE